jgi:zinc protease
MSASGGFLDLPFAKRTLANGLDVIVHEDHRVPVVGVNLWYRVGSRNERPGRTGFAHLFEHLMFEGSAHHDSGYFAPLQHAGAQVNGSTSADRTNYWEVVPTSAVDLALWMESDRMGYLLPALSHERFETQRNVVLNERRQSYENRPYGLAMMALMAALFHFEHPYRWPTIGDRADIEAMQFEDVQAFFRTYYGPANASLVLAGDIDTARGFDLAERYFGDIAGGPRPAPVMVGAETFESERRILLEDRVQLPRVYFAWHTPAMFAPDDAELDLVGDLVANGKTSRLYRSLVYEDRIALDVSAAQQSRAMSSVFVLTATAAPGRSLSDVAARIDVALTRLASDGPTEAEMERSRAQIEAHFLYRLQTVGGFGGKSDQLNAYNVLRGTPGYFQADLSRYQAATQESVRAAAARHLLSSGRVALSVVPAGQAAMALPGSQPIVVS